MQIAILRSCARPSCDRMGRSSPPPARSLRTWASAPRGSDRRLTVVSLCAASRPVASPRVWHIYLACRMVTQRTVASLPGYSAATWSHRYTDEHSDLLNGAHGRVYLDTQQPRVCVRGPEVRVTQPYAMPHPRRHWASHICTPWGCPFERALALHGLSHAATVPQPPPKGPRDLSNHSAVAVECVRSHTQPPLGRAGSCLAIDVVQDRQARTLGYNWLAGAHTPRQPNSMLLKP